MGFFCTFTKLFNIYVKLKSKLWKPNIPLKRKTG